MKLQDVFDQLGSGELAQLSILDDTGSLSGKNQQQVMLHIHMGLVALYSRFAIKRREMTLQLIEDQPIYVLSSTNAESSAGGGTKYILDSTDPFNDDLLRISWVRAGNEDPGYFPLDDHKQRYSLHRMAHNVLRVPSVVLNQDETQLPIDLLGIPVTVGYQAAHPKLDSSVDPTEHEIELPDEYLQALCFYVASRTRAPMGGTDTAGGAAVGWYRRYENECALLRANGNPMSESFKPSPQERGWP